MIRGIIARPVLCEVEKLTKPIRVGPVLLVSERLHGNLFRISQLIGNASMLSALRMAALEGSAIVLEKLSGNQHTIIDESIQQRVNAVLAHYELAIIECARVNRVNEVQALEILLAIGAQHASVNGYLRPEKDTAKGGKKRA